MERPKMKKNKKRGAAFVGAGLLCLALCIILLVTTESVFSTVFFYLSVLLNIIGVYILLWMRDGGEKDGTK